MSFCLPSSAFSLPLQCFLPVITGMGTYSAGGENLETLWKNVVHGNIAASSQELSRTGVQLPVYQASSPSFSGKEKALLRCADRSSQFAFVAACEAWQHAQLQKAAPPPQRMGVIIGSARGPLLLQEQRETSSKRPSDSLYSGFSSTSGILSHFFKIEGTAFMVSSSCTSSATALHLASQMIRTGTLDVILVGGTEAPLTESLLEQYQAAGILSQCQMPSKALAPFDQKRSGTVLGEGAAFLILESQQSAQQRGVPILGQLQAVAIATHSRHRAGLDPEALSLQKVLSQSLQEATLLCSEIGVLQPHGTGTILNDLLESRAIASLFGKIEEQPAIFATKAVTGHPLGAATLFQVILTLSALREKKIPRTPNCTKLDPACSLSICAKEETLSLSSGVCLTSGFWGNVASVVLSAKD